MARSIDSRAAPTPSVDGDAARTVQVLVAADDEAAFRTPKGLVDADVYVRFGNAEPAKSRSELIAAARSFRSSIGGLWHDIVDLWQIGDEVVLAIMEVH
jgi:hypothetical protein